MRHLSKLISVFSILIFSSCSNNQEPEVSTQNLIADNQSATIQQLMNINDSIQINTLLSRSGSRNGEIVDADIDGALKYGEIGRKIGKKINKEKGSTIGAIIGGIIGGTAKSLKAYLEIRPKDDEDEIIAPITMLEVTSAYCTNEILNEGNFTYVLELGENKEIEHIGEYHNRTLDYLINNGGVCTPQNDELGYPEDGPIPSENYVKISIMEESVLYSDEFFNEFNNDMSNLSNDDDFSNGGDNICHEIVDLYKQAINNYCSADEQINVVNITNLYIQTIRESSEISEEEKENLYIALSVGAYSYQYWNK
ncbi:MAG: hypothetical protein NC343_06855 [Muribaculum sp.]|nr:hypothetical protein [Muribaculaceae bacterium]MCM1081455.1 hypothetical protein [Muribaculum sp.]